MGVVYEAHDARRRGSLALKTLSRLDAGNVYRLKNEFRSLAEVSHPNLCRLYELFGEGGQWFFTMELVKGERFDSWLRSGDKLDQVRLRAALPQLCAGIAAIHAAGKLHRDLKPSNVLVTQDGRVVVLDFGLAVDPELGGVGQTVMDESVSGTPAYMAPEQAAGLPATAASDFYAVGVMLFEALTGKLPFEGRAHEMLVDKQRNDPPSVSASFPRLPSDLAALCDALLLREPAGRPDGEALRAKLGGVLRADSTEPRHSVMPERELLLGRDAELTQLRAAYEATLTGKPVVMFVTGESGMGKSALVTRFLDELRARDEAAVLAGRCHERESVPFKGIDSVVDDLSRFLRKLSATEASALMPREVYALARIFPVLGRIDAVVQAPKKDIVDLQELRQRAFAAFGELLARIRDRRPLVVHIDDAQWLDRDAVTCLGTLLGHYEPVAALFVLSHRSEGAASNALLGQVRKLALDSPRLEMRELSVSALPSAAALELARRLLGAQRAALAAELVLEAGGSPFFLRELSRQAQRSNGAAGLTLHEAVLAHAQSLPLAARHLLEVLAVAGRALPVALALEAAGASHEHIDTLHVERLLRSDRSGQERSLECYHDKIRESVVRGLSAEQQHTIHASLLAVLVEQKTADPEHLALHAEGAGDREAAARYALRAAAAASELMAFEQAVLLYSRALDLAEHGAAARRELLTKLGEAMANAGRGADAARAYLEAAAGADEDRALEWKRRAAEQLLISGHIDDGTALLVEVLRAVGLSLPRGPKAASFARIWERARLRLRGLSIRERKDELPVAQRRELDVLWTAIRGLQNMHSSAALRCRYVRLALNSGLAEHAANALAAEALGVSTAGGMSVKPISDALLDSAETVALASGRPNALAIVQLTRGAAAYRQGDLTACKAHCTQALETLREQCTGVAFELGRAHSFLQKACALLGDFAPAAELAALIDEAWQRGDSFTATVLTGSSSMARLVRGDTEGVQRHLEQARRQWRRPREYSAPDWDLLEAEILRAVYSNEPRDGLERLHADIPALMEAHAPSPVMLEMLRALRAGLALSAARERGADIRALRAAARSDASALARIRTRSARRHCRLIDAGLGIDEGRSQQAIAHLRAAGTKNPGVQRRLGQLLGGDEGVMLVAQADVALRAMGAVDLEATTRLFVLGMVP
jgi:hypothetical protein